MDDSELYELCENYNSDEDPNGSLGMYLAGIMKEHGYDSVEDLRKGIMLAKLKGLEREARKKQRKYYPNVKQNN